MLHQSNTNVIIKAVWCMLQLIVKQLASDRGCSTDRFTLITINAHSIWGKNMLTSIKLKMPRERVSSSDLAPGNLQDRNIYIPSSGQRDGGNHTRESDLLTINDLNVIKEIDFQCLRLLRCVFGEVWVKVSRRWSLCYHRESTICTMNNYTSA